MTEKYQKYLTEHINNVKICYKLLTGEELSTHDLSKFTMNELAPYDRYFYPEEFGTTQKAEESSFDYAWLHHQNHEPHHWQYWVLMRDSGEVIPLQIPERYVDEMVADWASFALKKKNPSDLLDFYKKNSSKMILHPDTRKLLEATLLRMHRLLEKYLG